MRFNQLKALAVLCLVFIGMQSCSEDSSVLNPEESVVNTGAVVLTPRNADGVPVANSTRGNNNQGGNNGNQGNDGNRGGQGNGDNGNNNDDGRGGNDGQSSNNLVASLDNGVTKMWMDLFFELERYADGMRPNASARALAYISLAAYETAVPGMPNFRSNSNRIPGFRFNGRVNTSSVDFEAALNATYARVFDQFMIGVSNNRMEKIDALENAIKANLQGVLSNRVMRDSEEWGEEVADRIISYARSDREGESQILEPQPLSYEPPVGDGYWTYSAEQERALFPYWESVRTFVMSTNETTTLDPIPYSEDASSAYFAEMQEVYDVNNTARDEDNDDLWVAEFWSDDVVGTTFGPPTRQFSIGNQLIEQYGFNLEETLHMYLKLGFALNDAAVSAWKYKYEHMVMRPNVFIHEFIDPDYQTNLYRLVPWPNPTFPGYPSGHSCFASAAAGVFKDFIGNNISFTDRSHEGRSEFRSTPRTYNSFDEMAEENAFSRIPLGVHVRMDCAEGFRLGYEISDGINEYEVQRDPS